ncbi:MAG: segregation/condensation protein A [Candidatus Micrarchaeia archaeon]|jgi:segregation and condensation protein A
MGSLLQIQIETKESKIDLERFVSEATWKDLLIELVKKNKLDPWNVDILEIVDKYVEAVKEFKTMDLRVPANIILAASILLHFKSEALYYEIEEKKEEENSAEPVQRSVPEIPPLSFRLRIPPKRKITLTELIAALEEAMKLKETKEQKKSETVNFPIKFENKDIELELNKLFEEIKASVDKKGMTTFSQIAMKERKKDPLVELFIPLLYLAHRERITLMQEAFFGEIIIAVMAWKSKTTKSS